MSFVAENSRQTMATLKIYEAEKAPRHAYFIVACCVNVNLNVIDRVILYFQVYSKDR